MHYRWQFSRPWNVLLRMIGTVWPWFVGEPTSSVPSVRNPVVDMKRRGQVVFDFVWFLKFWFCSDFSCCFELPLVLFQGWQEGYWTRKKSVPLTECAVLEEVNEGKQGQLAIRGLRGKRPLIHTHTHPFNGPMSRTTWVSRYKKGKTNLYFTEARDSEWQWHQLGHTQVCTLLQTDNHASTPPLSFLQADALPAAQPTVSKHWRQQNGHWYAGKNSQTARVRGGPIYLYINVVIYCMQTLLYSVLCWTVIQLACGCVMMCGCCSVAGCSNMCLCTDVWLFCGRMQQQVPRPVPRTRLRRV